MDVFLSRRDPTPPRLAHEQQRRVLCPELFRRLHRLTGPGGVLVANEGEHMTGSITLDTAGRRRWIVSTWGESYRINCPFCGDKRHRLWINYRFGQLDPADTSRMSTFYGICFNEDCLQDPDNRAWLVEQIFGLRNQREVFEVDTTGNVNSTRRLDARPLPGVCYPLTRLSAYEPAVCYLSERRFAQDTMEAFKLHYCVQCDEFPAVVGRIIVPIYKQGVCVGWQGRFVGEPTNKRIPKYFTAPGFPKRLTLYNIDRVADKPFVVVVEGVTDVWRLPDFSVALLGKTMSAEQVALLQATFTCRQPIVLCLDPETFDNCAMKVHEIVNRGTNPVVRIRLPDGCDPADCDTDVLLRIIVDQARSAGVKL